MSFRGAVAVPKSYRIDGVKRRPMKASVTVAVAGRMVSIGAVSKRWVVEQSRLDTLLQLVDLLHGSFPICGQDITDQLSPRSFRNLLIVGG